MATADPAPMAGTRLRYERLAADLLDDIRRQGLEPGDRLPGERELCALTGLSRGTVRRALAELQRLGAVEPAARGWRIARPRLGEPDALLSFSEMAARAGVAATSDVLVHRVRPATADEAAVLDLGDGSADVVELTRLRRLAGAPVGLEVTRLPAALAPFTAADFSRTSLYAFLREHGVDPARADYEVSAAVAAAWEASLLDVPPGTPVLVTEATTRDRGDRRIELSRSLFLADRYRFHATLLAETPPTAPPLARAGLRDTG